MNPAGALRAAMPPVAGAAVFLLAALAGGVGWIGAAVLGLVTWGSLAAFLYRRDPFRAMRRIRGLGIDPQMIRTELATAEARIVRIRNAAQRIDDASLSAPLLEIAATAETIAAEVLGDPRAYPRLRRVLVHHLEHTTAVAEGLAHLPAGHGAMAPSLARARDTLPQIVDAFRRQRDRLGDNEAFDVETRLTLLENDLARAAPRPPAPGPLKRK
jgi:hypothetical protein